MPLFRPGSTSAQKPSLSPRPFAGTTAPFRPGRSAAPAPEGAPSAVAAAAEPRPEDGPPAGLPAEEATQETEQATEIVASADAAVESFQISASAPASVLDTGSLTDGATSDWLSEPVSELMTSEASTDLIVDADPTDIPAPVVIEAAEQESSVGGAATMETEITSESAVEASFTWDEPVSGIHPEPEAAAASDLESPDESVGARTPQLDGLYVAEDAGAPMAADFQSLVVEADGRERTLEVLEAVARRVRAGEITVSASAGTSAESVLASLLASLLSTKP